MTTTIRCERFPTIAAHARTWLTIQANVGLAPHTVDAYGRALESFLVFLARGASETNASSTNASGVLVTDPNTVSRALVAAYVRELATRPRHTAGHEAAGAGPPATGAGLANATLHLYLVALRLYYDYLMEEGVRPDNPVGRGRYTPGKGFGGARDRGLLPRFERLPWIPSDEQWQAFLLVAQAAPVRTRFMLALAYDAALRREELCALEVADLDPAR